VTQAAVTLAAVTLAAVTLAAVTLAAVGALQRGCGAVPDKRLEGMSDSS
jgi:hypothetical protein